MGVTMIAVPVVSLIPKSAGSNPRPKAVQGRKRRSECFRGHALDMTGAPKPCLVCRELYSALRSRKPEPKAAGKGTPWRRESKFHSERSHG